METKKWLITFLGPSSYIILKKKGGTLSITSDSGFISKSGNIYNEWGKFVPSTNLKQCVRMSIFLPTSNIPVSNEFGEENLCKEKICNSNYWCDRWDNNLIK